MQRIADKHMQISGVRYKYTIETDGVRLFLSLTSGLKNDIKSINISESDREFRKRVYEKIVQDCGTYASNEVFRGDIISQNTRRYFNIPFPNESHLNELLKKLQNESHICFMSGAEEKFFISYLDFQNIKYVSFMFRNIYYVTVADLFIKELINNNTIEIKKLNDEIIKRKDEDRLLYNALFDWEKFK